MARKKGNRAAKKPETSKPKEPTVGAVGKEEVVETPEVVDEVAEVSQEEVVEEIEVPEEEISEVDDEEEVVEEEPIEENIPVEKDVPVKKVHPVKEKIIPAGKGPNKPKKRMFEIEIAENDGPDNGDVFATDPSDGTPFLIQRGQKVRVPVGVVNNLKESVTGKLSYDNEGNEVWKDISRFSMTVYGEVK